MPACCQHRQRLIQASPAGCGGHAVYELWQQRHDAGTRYAVSACLGALRNHRVSAQQHLRQLTATASTCVRSSGL